MLFLAIYVIVPAALNGLIFGWGEGAVSGWLGISLSAISVLFMIWVLGIAFQPLTGGWFFAAMCVVALAAVSFAASAAVGSHIRETRDDGGKRE